MEGGNNLGGCKALGKGLSYRKYRNKFRAVVRCDGISLLDSDFNDQVAAEAALVEAKSKKQQLQKLPPDLRSQELSKLLSQRPGKNTSKLTIRETTEATMDWGDGDVSTQILDDHQSFVISEEALVLNDQDSASDSIHHLKRQRLNSENIFSGQISPIHSNLTPSSSICDYGDSSFRRLLTVENFRIVENKAEPGSDKQSSVPTESSVERKEQIHNCSNTCLHLHFIQFSFCFLSNLIFLLYQRR